jgi:integrase
MMKKQQSRANEILPSGRFSQWRSRRSKNWSKASLKEYLQQFLIRIEPTLHPNTYKDYSQVVHDHIIPHIGSMKLKDLNPSHIQMLHSIKLENGATPTRVRFIHKILNRALNLSVRWGYRNDNPAALVTVPKKSRKEMLTFSIDEVRTFLMAVKGSRLEALFHVAVTSGLRQSEILGLQWPDLEWETGNLRIHRQLQRVHGRGLIFSEPKTAAGRRLIAIGPTTLKKLTEHKERQDIERQGYTEEWQELKLIFATSQGSPIGPRNLYRKFKSIIKSSGLPDIRFHDLRHTCATMMLQSGVNVKVIQTALGHSSVTITLDTYSHVMPGMQTEAAQMVDNLITESSRSPTDP